jgi:hypothetical protein
MEVCNKLYLSRHYSTEGKFIINLSIFPPLLYLLMIINIFKKKIRFFKLLIVELFCETNFSCISLTRISTRIYCPGPVHTVPDINWPIQHNTSDMVLIIDYESSHANIIAIALLLLFTRLSDTLYYHL